MKTRWKKAHALRSSNPYTSSRRIARAFRVVRGLVGRRVRINVFFEHDQWWVQLDGGDDRDRTFSVCDASGGAAWIFDGFCFEEV